MKTITWEGAPSGIIEQIARTLVFSGVIVPVLDGLDEMPTPLRPLAIEKLNRSSGAEQSVVVTCRADEYPEQLTVPMS